MENHVLQQKTALVIDAADNVAVALVDLVKGEHCTVRFPDREEVYTVLDDISFGHKLALKNINENESVLKFGEEIGKMSIPVQKGEYIHNHKFC